MRRYLPILLCSFLCVSLAFGQGTKIVGPVKVVGPTKIAATSGGAGPAPIGKANGSATGSSSSIATGTTLNVATGNLLSVTCSALFDPGTITVTDTAGNTFTDDGRGKIAANGTSSGFIQKLTAKNTIANAADTVTCNFTNAIIFVNVLVTYASGLSTTSPVDQTATDTGGNSSSPITTAAFTTTSANELAVCGFSYISSGSTFTAGTGFTLQNTTATGNVGADETQIYSGIQTGVTASFGVSPDGNFGRILCTTYH